MYFQSATEIEAWNQNKAEKEAVEEESWDAGIPASQVDLSPPPTYAAKLVEEPTAISTPWGDTVAPIGNYIFTSNEDNSRKFIVSEADANNENIWVPA